jgi:hypothetical protein
VFNPTTRISIEEKRRFETTGSQIKWTLNHTKKNEDQRVPLAAIATLKQ